MSRTLRRAIAVSTILVLAASACGNSGDDDDSSPTTEGGADGRRTVRRGGPRHLRRDPGVPGVTDDEITFAAIGTRDQQPARHLHPRLLRRRHRGLLRLPQLRGRHLRARPRARATTSTTRSATTRPGRSRWCRATRSSAPSTPRCSPAAGATSTTPGIPTYTWGIHAAEAAEPAQHLPEHGDPLCRLHRAGACRGPSARWVPPRSPRSATATSENSKVCTNDTADVDRALQRRHRRRRGRLRERRARASGWPAASGRRSPP